MEAQYRHLKDAALNVLKKCEVTFVVELEKLASGKTIAWIPETCPPFVNFEYAANQLFSSLNDESLLSVRKEVLILMKTHGIPFLPLYCRPLSSYSELGLAVP